VMVLRLDPREPVVVVNERAAGVDHDP
jgi:hypothetical protein